MRIQLQIDQQVTASQVMEIQSALLFAMHLINCLYSIVNIVFVKKYVIPAL